MMLTNLGKKEEVDKGFKMGAIDYLIKAHFVPSEVIKKIKQYLQKINFMATTAENLEIDRFLDEIVKNNATDVHLSVANPPYFRIDGQLTPLESKKIIAADYLEDLASYLLSEEQKKELEAEREITFGYTAKSGSRFKINIFYQSSQLSITIKVILLN